MKASNHRAALDAGRAVCLDTWHQWPGASEHGSLDLIACVMKRRILNWMLMLLAAAVFHVVFRYWTGDFQGRFTLPVGGTHRGFAHIKSQTVWFSGPAEFTNVPDILILGCMLASLAFLVFAVRLVYRSSVRKK
jgi:hypothetical protein